MYIDKGIDIRDGEKIRCKQCKTTLAVKNQNGEMFIRKTIIAYISVNEDIYEFKCRECGAINN